MTLEEKYIKEMFILKEEITDAIGDVVLNSRTLDWDDARKVLETMLETWDADSDEW